MNKPTAVGAETPAEEIARLRRERDGALLVLIGIGKRLGVEIGGTLSAAERLEIAERLPGLLDDLERERNRL